MGNTKTMLLSEADIPGASLNGKHPAELNVTQLKRWLACCAAPISGKKPELIERVCYYIKYGWDVLLIDPDVGTNVKQKLQARNRKSLDAKLIQSIKRQMMFTGQKIYTRLQKSLLAPFMNL